MRILLFISLLFIYSSYTQAQFPSLEGVSDPFAPNAFKVVRVGNVPELSNALGKLSGDTHIIIDSGTYALPVELHLKSYTRTPMRVRISPSVGGTVQFEGSSHLNLQSDLRLEMQRLHFSSEEALQISGSNEVLIDSCRLSRLPLLWLAPDSGSLKVVNSVFTEGSGLGVVGDEASRVSLIHNTWSGGDSSVVDVRGKGRIQLRLDNNIVSGSGTSALKALDSFNVSLEGRNNLFFGWENIGLDGEERLLKNRLGDPLLLADGFHLSEKSPAINAGAALGESVAVDVEGDYRGLRPDIGADEFMK